MRFNVGGERADGPEDGLCLFAFRGQRDAPALLDGKAELEGVDAVEAEPFAEERLIRVDVLRPDVFEPERGNDEGLDFGDQISHGASEEVG